MRHWPRWGPIGEFCNRKKRWCSPACRDDRKDSALTGLADDRSVHPPGDSAIAFTDVKKSYGDVHAVKGINFTIRRGEAVALLGPNGAGKSTSLEMLLGLRRPDHGSVQLFGTSPEAAIKAGQVGSMLQSGGLMPEVSVRDVVRLVRSVGKHPLSEAEIMDQAGIADIARRRVDRLSGGQVQRVRFALAIADQPDLIVLDEPTAGMDVATRARFWEKMRAQTDAGRTLLFATHYMDEADGIADRILVLHAGKILADATPAEVKARAGMRQISFEHETVSKERLAALPGVVDAYVHEGKVRLRSSTSDATLEALFTSGLKPVNVEVAGLGLEQAYLALTGDADHAAEADAAGGEGGQKKELAAL
jgi:ABC-2 type transport system ATP-binding protein